MERGVVSPLSDGFSYDNWIVMGPLFTSVRGLVNVFTSNKAWYNSLSDREGMARKSFVDSIAKITALPANGFEPEKIKMMLMAITERSVFMDHVRALVCPWTNTRASIRCRGLIDEMKEPVSMDITDDESHLLVISKITQNKYYKIPLYDCDSIRDGILVRVTPTTITTDDLLKAHDRIMEPEVLKEGIISMLSVPTPALSETTCIMTCCTPEFRFFPIHGAVFAISFACKDGYGCSEAIRSIYYYSIPDGRMLSHRTCTLWPSFQHHFKQFVLSRPFRLWIVSENYVHAYYMGNRDSAGKTFRVSLPSERIDPAMYMISKGMTAEAMNFVKSLPGATIDTPTKFNARTLVHVAADHDQVEALKELVKMGADTRVFDIRQNTPLKLAVRRLHHECVAILAGDTLVDPPCLSWEETWSCFCSLDTIRKCFARKPEEIHRYCTEVIPSITQSLWETRPSPSSEDDETYWLSKAARSIAFLSSGKALGFVFNAGFPITRFLAEGGFMMAMGDILSPSHEDEMIDCMRTAAFDWGVDFGVKCGPSNDYHLIRAVRDCSVKMVRFLIEELKMDTSVRNRRHENIKDVASGRHFRKRDDVVVELFDYVQSLEIAPSSDGGSFLYFP